jgi:hypothetical protein
VTDHGFVFCSAAVSLKTTINMIQHRNPRARFRTLQEAMRAQPDVIYLLSQNTDA